MLVIFVSYFLYAEVRDLLGSTGEYSTGQINKHRKYIFCIKQEDID